MGAVGVDTRLEPDPAVANFGIGKAFGNFQLHRIAACHCHIDLACANFDSLFDRITAHIRNICTCADQVQFGRRFMHPLAHSSRCNVDRGRRLQELVQQTHLRNAQMIALKADCLARARH